MTAGQWLSGIAIGLVAAAAGYVGSQLGLPLAWVLAPMMVTAAASLSGLRVLDFQNGRKIGQLIVGSAIGLAMTPEAIEMLLVWFPFMVLTAAVSVLVTALLAVPFARLGRLDTATGFFALTPGGLSEMARVGEREGARTEVISLSQALRVALLVTLLPMALLTFGTDGGYPDFAARPILQPEVFGAVLAASLAAMLVMRLLRANNPWMIGGLLGAGLIAGLGVVEGRAPQIPFAFGQFLIGITIGVRFKRENMAGVGRVLAVALAFILLMTGLLSGYAALLHLATGLDLSSAVLAASPGGMAEMALTANALHLNVVLVPPFHFVRSFIVNAYSLQFFRLCRAAGLFRATGAALDFLCAKRGG